VAKDFVLEYEEKEKINADRLTHQVDRHISTLKTLRSKLETRHELKTRTEEYRAWQREFNPKKQSILMGKTLEEYNATLPPKTANLSDPDAEIDDEAMRRGTFLLV
jgi:predicted transcriptional regulator